MTSGINKSICILFSLLLVFSVYADKSKSPLISNDKANFVTLKNYPDNGPALNTLSYGLFYVRDKSSAWERLSPLFKNFYQKRISGEIKILKRHPALKYNLWLNDKKGDLVFILPGTGGNFAGFGPAAMAHLFYSHGYSAVVISNAFNWEFMEAAGTTITPGCTLADSADVRRALERLMTHLRKKYPGHFKRKILLGSSMGALHTLYIRDYYEKHPVEFPVFNRYIALNPPVDMHYAMNQIESYYQTGIDWSKVDVQDKVRKLVVAYMNLVSGNALESTPVGTAVEKGRKQGDRTVFKYKLTENDAKFLIGMAFHINLRDVIYSLFMRDLTKAVKAEKAYYDQREIYKKIDKFNFNRYLDEILLPNFKKLYGKDISKERIFASSGLKYIQKTLSSAPDVYVFHNQDDFLLGKGDLEWLKGVMGKRLTVFSTGGHLGNLYLPTVQNYILNAAQK